MSMKLTVGVALFVAATGLSATTVLAQGAPGHYAITGARIVTVSG